MGLAHEVARLSEDIDIELTALVAAAGAPTAAELEAVSRWPQPAYLRPVIEALREENVNLQPQLITRLAGEMALARTMERAMIARRALLAGRDEPNVANVAVGVEEIERYIGELEQDIDNLLYESTSASGWRPACPRPCCSGRPRATRSCRWSRYRPPPSATGRIRHELALGRQRPGLVGLTTVVLVGMTLVLWWWGMDPVRRENRSVS